MRQINPSRRWGDLSVGLAFVAIVAIGALLAAGIFNTGANGNQANSEAMKRSLESGSFSSGPALVWRRTFGSEVDRAASN
jgi:hypothetical protein